MKRMLVGAAALCMCSPALAADMPVAKAPMLPPMFSWTGCYLGAHAGGGWATTDVTDPVQLVQDTLSGPGTTTGVTTTSLNPTGAVVGGQIGCDYQFAPSWVAGVEGEASGATLKASANVTLPASGDIAQVTARTDFITSASARFGYAADRWLFYVKGGAAWAGDKYDVTGTFTGTPFAFEGVDQRLGWMAGGGIDWAFYHHWSLVLEYDYYQFGHHDTVLTDPSAGPGVSPVDFKQTVQIAKIGLNFHMWDGR